MAEDAHLLRRFVSQGDQDAFTCLVERHVNLVYSAALRQLGGDAHLAWDATQAVFIALAQNAPRLTAHAALTGWLYTATRFVATKMVRGRRRWQMREHEAQKMNEILSDSAAPSVERSEWREIRPVLDATMHELDQKDREAILLRFFEERAFAEIAAVIGTSENTARMRVERALEKLRTRLAKRGITSTAAALAGALATQTTVAAPAGLAAAASANGAAAFASATLATGGTLTAARALIEFMSITKVSLGALGLAAAFGIGALVGNRSSATRFEASPRREMPADATTRALQTENQKMRDELAALRAERTDDASQSTRAVATARASDSGGEWRILADLQKKKVVRADITFVNPMGKLNDAFANLFELTPAERDALQQAVGKATDQLADLVRANATLTRDNNGGVQIVVKPFTESGSAVYDELMKSFAQTLGPDRNAAFLSLGAEQVERALGGFGAAQRTVTVGYNPPGSAAQVAGTPFHVRDELRAANSSWVFSGDCKDLADFAGHIGTIAHLLPPDFGGGK